MATRDRRFVNARRSRKGAIAVLAVLLLIVVLGMVAFAIDVGYLLLARSEAQRSADAAAMAGAWELAGEAYFEGDYNDAHNAARDGAIGFAQLNAVCQDSPTVDRNAGNSASGDIVLGRLSEPSDPNSEMTFGDPARYNAVRVRISRSTAMGNPVPFFFAGLLGVDNGSIMVEATAAFQDEVSGFRVTDTSGPSSLMPFVIHEDTWADYQQHPNWFDDNFSYNASSDAVSTGGDGKPEIRMFTEGPGNNNNGNNNNGQTAPGNFGTVDIGGANNSTADIERQILYGPSVDDMELHGGKLELDSTSKTMLLNGDTGISSGMADELVAIKGKPRTIMIYREVAESGNTAQYTITGFVGVTVVDVSLTGGDKYILIQPTPVVDRTAISTDTEGTSHYVTQPGRLVR